MSLPAAGNVGLREYFISAVPDLVEWLRSRLGGFLTIGAADTVMQGALGEPEPSSKLRTIS
jgi:hypothetical protein